jgi:hypothetical protein
MRKVMVLIMVKLRHKGEMVLQLRQKEEMRRKTMANPLKRVVVGSRIPTRGGE